MKIVSMGALLMDQVASVGRFPGIDDEVFASDLKWMPGGSAANTAVFCARLGMETGFIGRVGDDAFGRELVEGMRREGVSTKGIIVSKEHGTGTVFISVDPKGERSMVAYSGAANKIKPDEINLAFLNSHGLLHLACLENIGILEYAAEKFKGRISICPGALVAEKGKEAHGLVSHADIFIGSRNELAKLSGAKDLERGAAALCKLGPSVVVVTLGSEGAMASDGDKTYRAGPFKVNPKDTTGAGDAFVAGFLKSHTGGAGIEESLRFGNACAAINIREVGARAGLKSLEQVKRFISKQPHPKGRGIPSGL